MGSYRDLLAWQQAIELVDQVYAAVRLFPRGSNLELQTQIIIAGRQQFIDREHARLLFKKAARVGRLLNGLLRSLNAKT